MLALLAFVVLAPSAEAAFPGINGKLAFTSDRDVDNLEVYAMSSNGSGQVNFSNDPDSDSTPSWSPDGSKIAFSSFRDQDDEIYVMNADGTAQTRITNSALSDTSPTWSPNGQKIAFTRDDGSFNLDIYVMNSDGSGQTPLTTDLQIDTGAAWSPNGLRIAFTSTRDGDSEIFVMNADGASQTNLTANTVTDSGPDWSPDGQKIAFSSRRDGNAEIYVMNADGTGAARLTTNAASESSPAWSPDGAKIAFRSTRDGNSEIYVMNADGTGQTRLTTDAAIDIDPDWQSVTPTGYPRPKGASPLRASLVPAYEQCPSASANRTHGPALAFPSCNPPVPQSDWLTVGSPDANGAPANFVGSLRVGVIAGDPATPADEADVKFTVSVADVRTKSGLTDYTGQLQGALVLRMTDKLSGSSLTEPATVQDISFPVTIACASTADATVGSTCSANTTADAITPGAVTETKRTIWQVDQVKVFDGGSDGLASTAPNTLFAVQGIFIP